MLVQNTLRVLSDPRVDSHLIPAYKLGHSKYHTYRHRAREAWNPLGAQYPDKSQQAVAVDGKTWGSLGILSHLNHLDDSMIPARS